MANSKFRYSLSKTSIINDLGNERPTWILSAYGPGIRAPIQLFGGVPREQSFEEMRIRHYELAASGNQQQAIQEAQALVKDAELQMQNALKDVDGAIKYIISGKNQHPNRLDVCEARGSIPSHSQLGQPSSFGSQGSNLASSRPSTSFGQPSIANSTFGKPSSLGQPQPVFSQPAATFGKPSAFRQPSPLRRTSTIFGQPTSTFSQKSISTSTSAFGQSTPLVPFGLAQAPPSTLKAASKPGASQPQNPFATPAASSQPTTFGQPLQPAPSNPFGQPSARIALTTFGQPSAPNSNVFGQPSASHLKSTFGQPSHAKPNPFAPTPISQPSTLFPKSSAPSNTLGQPSNPAPTIPFGQPSNNSTPPTTLNHAPTLAPPPPLRTSTDGPTTRSADGKLTTWKGKPVSYIDNEPCFKSSSAVDSAWEKVWFPDGPPTFVKMDEVPVDQYNERTKECYRLMREKGHFEGGWIPEEPPRREWCRWDF